MKRNWNCTNYFYKGLFIYKITQNDWCVFSEDRVIVHEETLRGAKEAIDKIK